VIGVITSIPLFANGILQRTLTRDLMQHQQDTGVFPGYINLAYTLGRDEDIRNRQRQLLSRYADTIPSRFGVPLDSMVHFIRFESLRFLDEDDPQRIITCRFRFQSDLENHITMLYGRTFNPTADPTNGTVDVMITDEMMHKHKMIPEGVYTVSNVSYAGGMANTNTVYVRVAGVFQPNSEDAYWQSMLLSDTFFLPYESFETFAGHPFSSHMSESYLLILDYAGIKIENVTQITEEYAKVYSEIAANLDVFTQKPITTTFMTVIDSFENREGNLQFLLQLLNIPILIMLFYYIFMIAKMKISDEEAFIAVIRSRGASGRQIFLLYLLESVAIGLTAVIIGLPLGWAICRVIGSANGFLDFVSRAALPLRMSMQVYMYAAVAFLCIVVAAVVPALAYSRTSIVEQKRKLARPKKPIWKVLFIDVITLGLSLYYLYVIRDQTELFQGMGFGGTEAPISLPLYFISTVFAIGAGLCFLRVYPWLVSLVYLIGRRFWSPVTYAAFHTIKRSGGTANFLMLFIIIALSIGLFNAGAARTINRNVEDRIFNALGSDIVTQQYWTQLDEQGNYYMSASMIVGAFGPGGSDRVTSEGPIIYEEPPFIDFKALEGVDGVARVMQMNASIRFNRMNPTVSFIAFEPYEFAQTTWWRSDLAPYHLNEYMQIMMEYPNAVILSESLRTRLGVKEGDRIRIENLHRNRQMEVYVFAFAEFWPSFEPFRISPAGEYLRNHFVVANFDYLSANVPKSPYNVWINKSPGVSDAFIYDQLAEMSASFRHIETATTRLVAAKNDPVIQGTNGAMSLGFIIAMVICAMGFLVYWILSINARMLQFGIIRAMGMTRRKLLRMLIYEQILVSGTALIVGVITGHLAVVLFVPNFSLLYSGSDLNIPFRIFLSGDDSIRIYIVFGIMLLSCLLVLGHMLRRINIAKVIKFGED